MNRTALYLLALCESEIFHSGLNLVAMIHKNKVHVFHNINWDHEKRVLEPETVNSFQDVIDFMDKANNELSTTPDREGEAVDTRYEENRILQLA
jgi:hypothetical protein